MTLITTFRHFFCNSVFFSVLPAQMVCQIIVLVSPMALKNRLMSTYFWLSLPYPYIFGALANCFVPRWLYWLVSKSGNLFSKTELTHRQKNYTWLTATHCSKQTANTTAGQPTKAAVNYLKKLPSKEKKYSYLWPSLNVYGLNSE